MTARSSSAGSSRRRGRRGLPGGVVAMIPKGSDRPQVIYRQAGDEHLLVEYGEMVLDLNLRFRVDALERAIRSLGMEAISELAPGVRSLLLRYDALRLSQKRLIETLASLEERLPAPDCMSVSSRVVHLPITYRDRWTREAVARYMESVRAEAPYLPDNVEFVARCNGLGSPEEVVAYHTASQHLVLGLGDVYLGAPCAVPLDPRYRLVVPKYNPTRVWTPEGAVGIGGAYTCIYPMESPGGYQLVGRTLSIWNTWQQSPAFAEAPWLLRFFDRVQFEVVSEAELEERRAAMVSNSWAPRIEDGTFSVKEYNAFLKSVAPEAESFKARQRAAAAIATVGY